MGLDKENDSSTSSLPKPSPVYDEDFVSGQDCLVHLKLLTAFIYLREDISKRTDLFLSDADVRNVPEAERQQFLEEKRWALYVARAVKRFERWFYTQAENQKNVSSAKVTTSTCTSKGMLESLLKEKNPLRWSADTLPPLDVLMVLHSFMLNPRWFFDDCLRLGMVSLWSSGMPWRLLDECIDNRTFTYQPPDLAQSAFSSATGAHWDNLDDKDADLLTCRVCHTSKALSADSNANAWLSHENFTLLCNLPCHSDDHLRTAQFIQLSEDIEALQKAKVPLRGTILDENGLAKSQTSVRSATQFTNRLFSLVNVNDLNDWSKSASDGPLAKSVDEYFTHLQHQSTKKTNKLRAAKTNPFSSGFDDAELYSFNRARTAYSEGPSLFSLDLTAAVLRQGKFVQQMRDIDWIHSPGLPLLVENLIDKYEVFLDVMRVSKRNEVSVPTLAVDLAWHTHQLSPARYYRDCRTYVNDVFIDHDDRIGEGDLDSSFKRTTEVFKRLTNGGDYSQCLCWHCAAMTKAAQSRTDGGDVKPEVLAEMKACASADMQRAQAQRFVDDYNRYHKQKDADNWDVYMVSYKWPYPDYVPSQQDIRSLIS